MARVAVSAAAALWQSRAVAANLLFILTVMAYALLAVAASEVFGFPLVLRVALEVWPFVNLSVGAVLIGATVLTLARNRPDRPLSFVWGKLVGEWQAGRRIAHALPVLLLMPVFFALFTSVKVAIPAMMPYYADPAAASLDRLIHGADAWRILQPALGFPVATVVVNFFYNLWLFVVFIVLGMAALMIGNDRLRSRFLVAFVLTWGLLGNVLAVALSSAGPCYYEAFYGDGRFADLVVYLREASSHYPILAPRGQEGLLHIYRLSEVRLGAGISALPSVHVAMAALIAVFAFHFSRGLGWLACAFAAVILVGSVHLGWHYAVDGYLSLLLVPVIWWLAGKISGTAAREAPGERTL